MNKLKAKSGRQGERQSDVNSKSNSQQETSFAQSDNKFCQCCGSKDHLSFDCSKKDKVPRYQWYVNKMHSHVQQSTATDDQQRNEDAGPSLTNRNDNNQSTASATSATQTWYKSPPPRTGDVNCQIKMDETEFLLHQEAISVRDQILLDTGSSMNLFCNSRLLSGMPFLADKPIQMLTNGGPKVHQYKGNVLVFNKPVWLDPVAIVNIMFVGQIK